MFNEQEADSIVNNILRSKQIMDNEQTAHVEYDFITKDNSGNVVRVMKAELLNRDELVTAFEKARDALEAFDALVEEAKPVEPVEELLPEPALLTDVPTTVPVVTATETITAPVQQITPINIQ